MNQKIKRVVFAGGLMGMGLFVAGGLFAKGGSGSHHWFDGKIKRTVHIMSGYVAEILPAGGTSRMARADAGAVAAGPVGGTIRLWKVSVNAKALSGKSGMKTSPVFSDRAGGGRLRALPGNVIVRLGDNLSPTQVESWVKARGLKLVRHLPLNGNWIVIHSPAGLASLTLANQLHARGDVVNAQPNWWTQVRTR